MWKIKLRDNREITIKYLTVKDKDRLFQLFSSMSDVSLRWSMAPYSMERIQRWVGNLQNLISLAAEYKNKFVGYASIHRFQHSRRRGVGDLLIYLHQDFHNLGLGTVMTRKLLQLAKKERMHKIELHVVAENKTAIRLYEKFNFKIEGISKESFLDDDGKYHDMLHMGLILK